MLADEPAQYNAERLGWYIVADYRIVRGVTVLAIVPLALAKPH